jgi:hypothetical protein
MRRISTELCPVRVHVVREQYNAIVGGAMLALLEHVLRLTGFGGCDRVLAPPSSERFSLS